MSQLMLLTANPKRRHGGKKRRSAAQRAATKRMLAANRARAGHNPKRKRSRRRSTAVAAAPRRARRSAARRVTRRSRSRIGRIGRSLNVNNAVSLLKTGAIGGVGAIGVDLLMGYGSSVLPSSVTTRLNADGSTNWMYYGTKGALAVALGTLGGKLIPPAYAEKMAAGSLTVMSYELLRSMMPASVTLGRVGYMNPAAVLNRVGKIVPLQRRTASGAAPGMGRIIAFNQGSLQSRTPTAKALFAGAQVGRSR